MIEDVTPKLFVGPGVLAAVDGLTIVGQCGVSRATLGPCLLAGGPCAARAAGKTAARDASLVAPAWHTGAGPSSPLDLCPERSHAQ